MTLDPYAPMPRRRWPFLVAAAVLVALIASGITYAITAGWDSTGDDEDASGPIMSGLPIGQTCPDFPDAPEGVPTEAPEVEEWVTLGLRTYPRSATSGPARPGDDDTVDRCFARTPLGALLAAEAQGAASTAPDALPDLLDCCLTGPNVINDRELYESGEVTAQLESQAAAGVSGRVVGFRFESTSDTEVVVTSLSERTESDGETSLLAVTVRMLWVDGDWRSYSVPVEQVEIEAVEDPVAEGFTSW